MRYSGLPANPARSSVSKCHNPHTEAPSSPSMVKLGVLVTTSSLASRNSEVDLDLVVLEGDQGQGRSGVGRTRTAGDVRCWRHAGGHGGRAARSDFEVVKMGWFPIMRPP
jgi:hypothetical protein